MGPEIAALGAADLIPAALSIGGMLMQKNAADDAQDRQQAQLNSMLARDARYADRAQQMVQKTAEDYRPQVREPAEQQAEDTAYQSLASRLTTGANAMPTAAVAGRVSDDFLTDQAKRTAMETGRAADTARLMAKLRAPNDLRFGEGLTRANNAAEIGSLSADRSNMATAGRNDAQVAGQPSGTQMMLGDLATGAGTAMLGKRLLAGAKKQAEPVIMDGGGFWGDQ